MYNLRVLAESPNVLVLSPAAGLRSRAPRSSGAGPFARHLLTHVPKTHADMVAAVFRTIFAQPDAEAVSTA